MVNQKSTRFANLITAPTQSVQDCINTFEEIFNRLSAIDSPIAEDLQVAMLLASFDDKRKFPIGHLIASLQTIQENLHWETATARLLQESEEQSLRQEHTKPVRTSDI